MNLWLRLLRVILASLRRPRLVLTEESVLDFRVVPTDLDINIHMNNARYLALMDLGRLDLIIRSGLWRAVVKERWSPVLGGCIVQFRRPLRPFQRFVLKSRMLSWDDKWVYIDHRVESEGALVCYAMVRGAFVGRGGVRSRRPVGRGPYRPLPVPTPPLPPWAQAWSNLAYECSM
ncbi:thioesterase family protein [Pararhodospirillum photometricum]|uniref:thioesterase family protein n=1 Tax=Pararhodospirillum photometricum TaxID=1084 RepID=UPI0005A02D21|nr:thioesterase family protein [Pararhodospirillum photometricum]